MHWRGSPALHLWTLMRTRVHWSRVSPACHAALTHRVTHLTHVVLLKSSLPGSRTLLHGCRDARGPTLLPRTLTHATILDARTINRCKVLHHSRYVSLRAPLRASSSPPEPHTTKQQRAKRCMQAPHQYARMGHGRKNTRAKQSTDETIGRNAHRGTAMCRATPRTLIRVEVDTVVQTSYNSGTMPSNTPPPSDTV